MIRRFAVAMCAAFALAPQVHGQSFDATDPALPGADPSDLTYAGAGYAEAPYADDFAGQDRPPADYGAPPSGGRRLLGYGRLTNNDLLGDGKDRWQTGSLAVSRISGQGDWTGMLPTRPFDILEYRLGVQIVAPANLRRPAAGDRPWAGAVSLGVHTHFMRGPAELSMGADLAFTGPQTGLGALQTAFHDALGVPTASRSVLSHQIKNGVHPTLVLEAGNSIGVGGQAVLRPFAEARAGLETMVRVGADLTIGTVGQGELLVRDAVTGQRYRAVKSPLAGFSYVLGGDLAYVDSSALLPSDRGYDLTDTRNRLRAGLHWQGERNAMFYGVTWMSKEFEAQDTGQTLGSVRLDFNF